MYVVKAKEIVMSKENKSNSKYLNSIKDEQEKNQDKINVDRTYVEPQNFNLKNQKRQSSLFRFTRLNKPAKYTKNLIFFLI